MRIHSQFQSISLGLKIHNSNDPTVEFKVFPTTLHEFVADLFPPKILIRFSILSLVTVHIPNVLVI